MITVSPIRPGQHRDAWLSLWYGYHDFYRNEPSEEATEKTFGRLCVGTDGFFGLVAENGGEILGLAHAIFHPSTWTESTYCYLEDLFVSQEGRGTGAGLALIEGVYAEADKRNADCVYWHTQQYNAPARSLYDAIGHATSFIVYER